MEPAQVDDLLSDLEQSRPDAAQALKGMLFKFDDIVHLSAQARSILFDQVPTERVVIALKGASSPLCEAVLSTLAARARRMVEAELARNEVTPEREIAKARRAIADLVLSLSDRGLVELTAPDPADG